MTAFSDRLTRLRSYDHTLGEVAFLLGGIGTGNVSVGARGELRDWEIWNAPGKGVRFPYSFFALHVDSGGNTWNRMLEARLQPPFANSHGFDSADTAGLPRFPESRLRAEYPLCCVDLVDEQLPVRVRLEAFTPFVPLDADASSWPCAVLRYFVRNVGEHPAFVSVAGSLANMTTAYGHGLFNYVRYHGESINTRKDGALRGVHMESQGFAADHPMARSMAIATTNEACTIRPTWYQGAWYDSIQDFWDAFSRSGKLSETSRESGAGNEMMRQVGQKIGTVAPWATIAPGDETMFEFFLTWHMPNRIGGWDQAYNPDAPPVTIGNHYALPFENAWDVAESLAVHLPRLERLTHTFHEALFGSTLPDDVLDAVAANITVLRSTTCFRVDDGQFYGWEGCFPGQGCCDGSCTHVWNYEATLPYLFPELAQSMRKNEFLYEVEADGKMNFRSRKQLGGAAWDMPAAVDGQNGTIVRLYREWKLSGNDQLINDLGPSALRALDYALPCWDQDGDLVLDSEQHNTYDIEFFGPNSLANSMYLAALKAGVEIARHLGQEARAQQYAKQFALASQRVDDLLWGGEYYVQKLDDINAHRYQYGVGCLSDQVLGQYMAHVAGLGYVLPEAHVRQAIHSVFLYNFRPDLSAHENVQRTFALNDEAGLLLCSWPHGGRPRFPFVYSDEVWTGIEYQVAASLIFEGFVDEGLTLVSTARARHDGLRRNPFNEVECGNHYARAMAAWAVLIALSGHTCDLTRDEQRFDPKINQNDFQCFFSNGREWGVYRQRMGEDGQFIRDTQVLYTKGASEKQAPA